MSIFNSEVLVGAPVGLTKVNGRSRFAGLKTYLSFRFAMNSSIDTLSKSTKSAFPYSRLSCSAILPFVSSSFYLSFLETRGKYFFSTSCFEVPTKGEHWRASAEHLLNGQLCGRYSFLCYHV